MDASRDQDYVRDAPARAQLVPTLTVALLAVAAAVIALPFLGRESFGHDEGTSIMIARLNWGDLWHILVSREANMGLYYVLLHFWVAAGDGEVAVRLLSVLPAVLTVPTLYLLGRRVSDERCALAAASFLALNGFFIYYAQEARAYALVVFLVTFATLLFVKALDARTSTAVWIAYVVIAALAVYTHFFAVFVLCAHAIAFVLYTEVRHASRRDGIAAFVATGTLVTPLVLFMFTRNSGQLDWLDRPGLRDIVSETSALAGRSRPLALAYGVAVAVAVWAVLRRWRSHSLLSVYDVLVFGWLLVPIAGSLFLSVFSPTFISRYLIVSLPALALTAAVGVTSVPWRWGGVLLCVLLIVLSGRSIALLHQQKDKEDWRGATAYVAARSRPTDGIIVYTMPARGSLEVYVAKEHLVAGMPRPLYPSGNWGSFSLLGPRTPNLERLAATLPRFRRVWLVLSHDLIDGRRRRWSKRIKALLSNRPQLEDHFFASTAGSIRVRLYGRASRG